MLPGAVWARFVPGAGAWLMRRTAAPKSGVSPLGRARVGAAAPALDQPVSAPPVGAESRTGAFGGAPAAPGRFGFVCLSAFIFKNVFIIFWSPNQKTLFNCIFCDAAMALSPIFFFFSFY